MRGILGRLAGEAGAAGAPGLPRLVSALVTYARLEGDVLAGDIGVLAETLRTVMLAESPSRTLRATLTAAQRLGSVVRDQMSLDTWRVLNRLDRDLERLGAGDASPLAEVLDVSTGSSSRSPRSRASAWRA